MKRSNHSKHKRTILVIDDENDMRSALVDRLLREGFVVLQASNGNEGLASIFKEHPDLILLDIVMPGMDGLTVRKKVREDTWGKNVPIIILTNYSVTENTLQEILHDTASLYLVKSDCKIAEIIATVNKQLAQ